MITDTDNDQLNYCPEDGSNIESHILVVHFYIVHKIIDCKNDNSKRIRDLS